MLFNRPEYNQLMNKEELLEKLNDFNTELTRALNCIDDLTDKVQQLEFDKQENRILPSLLKVHDNHSGQQGTLLRVIEDLRNEKKELIGLHRKNKDQINELVKAIQEKDEYIAKLNEEKNVGL